MLGRPALVIAERADGVLTIEHRPQLAGLPFLYVVHTISQHARRSLPPLANFPILPGGRGLTEQEKTEGGTRRPRHVTQRGQCEVLGGLAQLPRTPLWRSSVEPQSGGPTPGGA